MVNIIKRTTDNKYLKSLENDVWVENINDAFKMTFKECLQSKETLMNTYTIEQIKEIIDLTNHKPISKEEKKELLNLLRFN